MEGLVFCVNVSSIWMWICSEVNGHFFKWLQALRRCWGRSYRPCEKLYQTDRRMLRKTNTVGRFFPPFFLLQSLSCMLYPLKYLNALVKRSIYLREHVPPFNSRPLVTQGVKVLTVASLASVHFPLDLVYSRETANFAEKGSKIFSLSSIEIHYGEFS